MKEPKIRFKGFQGEWNSSKYEEVFSLIGDTGHNVQKNEYCERGSYPVVDQSKEYIVGYTDKVMPIDGSKGLIIFGDHTREIKYIDFPFCTGADGTRILKSEQSFDARFLYYVCHSLNIPNTGYNRHFKYIQEAIYHTPETIAEQQSIASFFQHLDSLIQSTTKKIESLKQVKAASLQSMFPQEGETTPRVRFKGFEGEWETDSIENIAIIIKGEQINKSELSNYGTYYVLNGGVSPSGYTEKFNTKSNTISISEGGNSCGYVSYNNQDFWSGGHNYTLQNVRINNNFLFAYLKSKEYEIMSKRVGSGLPNIQKKSLQVFLVHFPLDGNEQRAIASFFTNLDRQITLQTQRLEKLKQIKAACLDKMFV